MNKELINVSRTRGKLFKILFARNLLHQENQQSAITQHPLRKLRLFCDYRAGAVEKTFLLRSIKDKYYNNI